MTTTTSLLRQGGKSNSGLNVSGLYTHEIKQLCLLIALPLVGMLLLLLCFLLQGVFAALGPWVIFVGAKLVSSRVRAADD
jgi:uncharacterized membrane protein